MKLYVKQKYFSLNDRFGVVDDEFNDVYLVEGEWFTLEKKLSVFTSSNEKVVQIRKQLFKMTPHVLIERKNKSSITLIRSKSLFKHTYSLSGINWQLQGDFLGSDYQIKDQEKVIATLSKAWLQFSDYYELDVYEDEHALDALCVVLAMDVALASSKQL